MFNAVETEYIKHDFCATCMELYAPSDTHCKKCMKVRYDNPTINENSSNKTQPQPNSVNYFCEVPVTSIVHNVFKRNNIVKELQYQASRKKFVKENYEDIYDGSLWQHYKSEGLLTVS